MEWITSLLEGENGSAIQLVLITAGLALALIILFWLFRRIAGTPARRAAKNRVPRLSITDFKDIGDKRHLILARRDNVEHLILIGGPNDVVIETGIVRAQSGQNAERTAKPVAKNKPPRSEPVIKVEDEKPDNSVSEASTAAVAGTATTMAASASETVSLATENVADTVAKTIDPVVDTSAETVETVTEAISEPVDVELEIEVIETIEIAEPEAVAATEADDVEISFDESDLEATLSDALTSESLIDDVSTDATAADSVSDSAPAVDTDVKQASSPDDEMQKLLAELASETKEPA